MSDILKKLVGDFLGTIEGKTPGGYQPPTTETYRERFSYAAKSAANKIRAGDEPELMGWYTRRGHAYVVTLRMGVKPIDCGDGRMRTVFTDADQAAQFLEATAAAALAGELDELLEKARPKKRSKT